ncbi:hypothetical protein F0562_025675 [Nyssa sinensis]|uniref:Dynamin-type G domain-containing protein n=1 Tax=Nyssa sinensis TaxID=561372 RepID=A0A5J5B6Y5_9ASTE|nr:hypothetical protein F0562_025675 [Nyssa sinensis]
MGGGPVPDETPLAVHAPLVISYNDRIRPLLAAVDKLRYLKVMQEGIQLPTIVVVGDQSSGKSSVLESLAGINLPRGQGICTRVRLIMRLQHQPNPHPELFLEFHGQMVPTDETHIANAINDATNEIAGDGKGISHTPLTLIVKRNGVPDLTMVNLPAITRVPRVDKTGERTLAVVTKADKAPEGLLEKVTADDVNIGLGYVCVRNRISDESYEDAQMEEARLFDAHPLLSKIDKSMVGIPVLAQKLRKVKAISATPLDFVSEVWNYMETVVLTVLMQHSENYPQVHSSTRRAAENLMAKMMEKSVRAVMDIVDCIALHLLLSIQMLVNRDMDMVIVNELMGSGGCGIEWMLEEAPSVAGKRERLNKSIKLRNLRRSWKRSWTELLSTRIRVSVLLC